jgi:hypothetical protein
MTYLSLFYGTFARGLFVIELLEIVLPTLREESTNLGFSSIDPSSGRQLLINQTLI